MKFCTDVTVAPPTPRFDSFYFGMFTCASCLGHVTGPDRVSEVLALPVFGDQAETEILIPAGRQSFHRECWQQHREGSISLMRGVLQ